MLLTIGMIMKNEERFLRDCLTAIKPILDNVDSELIIHDTGSTDNSIAIAKEFTDNVFEIEWRDD
ncbi:MAG: glycosyltransferase, partial [Firmicutes bacterium]|nr:glycosyltransferase [Bacillota bacterium]